ncbi:hypothetical protein HG530_002385 [Fusarium avenaceum]|nr:hypothetical protein DER45DRAFT_645449 [Fusarium avenaceum]KAI6775627.1 hypothetical protein HG530_002385 [Fusarium avenaceum]
MSNITISPVNGAEPRWGYKDSTKAEFVGLLSIGALLAALGIGAYVYDTAVKMNRIRDNDHVKDTKVVKACKLYRSSHKHNIIAMISVWLCMCYLSAMSWFIVVQKRDMDPLACIAAVSLSLGVAFIFQLIGSYGSLTTFLDLAKSSDTELVDRSPRRDNDVEGGYCSGGLGTPYY